jgi:hypothetical protein
MGSNVTFLCFFAIGLRPSLGFIAGSTKEHAHFYLGYTLFTSQPENPWG